MYHQKDNNMFNLSRTKKLSVPTYRWSTSSKSESFTADSQRIARVRTRSFDLKLISEPHDGCAKRAAGLYILAEIQSAPPLAGTCNNNNNNITQQSFLRPSRKSRHLLSETAREVHYNAHVGRTYNCGALPHIYMHSTRRECAFVCRPDVRYTYCTCIIILWWSCAG